MKINKIKRPFKIQQRTPHPNSEMCIQKSAFVELLMTHSVQPIGWAPISPSNERQEGTGSGRPKILGREQGHTSQG